MQGKLTGEMGRGLWKLQFLVLTAQDRAALTVLNFRDLYVCGGSTEGLSFVDTTEVLKKESGNIDSLVFFLSFKYRAKLVSFQTAGSGAAWVANFGNAGFSR
jgi:hypothetical protein